VIEKRPSGLTMRTFAAAVTRSFSSSTNRPGVSPTSSPAINHPDGGRRSGRAAFTMPQAFA
jgi:hypothetical protein